MAIELCRLTRFIAFLTKIAKNGVYRKFWTKKTFPKFLIQFCFLSHQTYTYVNLSMQAHQNTSKSHFSKKRLCPWKKFSMGKNFNLDIFILKHVLDHSKSISTKKNFRKFFVFWSFIAIFGPKSRFFEFLRTKFWNFFYSFQKECIVVILRYCKHPYDYWALQAH